MRNLEANDWLTLNSIIYNIYTTEEPAEMRRHFIEQMKMMIDFDSADFYLADCSDEQLRLTSPVCFNCDTAGVISEELPSYCSDIIRSGRSIVYKDSDVCSDDIRQASLYYQKLYRANSWHHSMTMIIGRDGVFLGKITFYRTIGKDNFLYDDIFIADLLKEHLAYRLSRDKLSAANDSGKLTITQASEKYELTNRETDILQHLMAGLDNDEICSELCISVNTLKKHILNIYRKLDINNRIQLFKMIREQE